MLACVCARDGWPVPTCRRVHRLRPALSMAMWDRVFFQALCLASIVCNCKGGGGAKKRAGRGAFCAIL